MTNIEFSNARKRSDRRDITKMQTMACIRSQTLRNRHRNGFLQTDDLGLSLFCCFSLRVRPRMEFDHGRTSVNRSRDLTRIRINKQRHANAACLKLLDSRFHCRKTA